MKMRLGVQNLLGFVILWAILGYPFLAALTSTFGGDNTLLSIAIRGLVAAVSVFILFYAKLKIDHKVLALFLAFWAPYFMRMTVNLHLSTEPTRISAEIYWIWAVFVCFLPSLAVLFSYNRTGTLRLLHLMLAIGFVTILMYLFVAEGSRLETTTLNPISMGHLGATVALLGVSMLAAGTRGHNRVILFGVISIATMLVLFANSRGPMISLAAALTLLFIARARRKSTLVLGFSLLCVTAYTLFINLDSIVSEQGVLSRFTAIAAGEDMSTSIRLVSFRGALDQFLTSPVFGDALEESITQFYPHNVILEAFMATGLVGGLPFVLLTLMAMHSSWCFVRNSEQEVWIGLITVQYIVAAQFSGAIYQSSAMWVMMALAITANQTKQKHSRRELNLQFAANRSR